MGEYEIKNIDDPKKADEILKIFYGNMWPSVLDRLPVSPDGYIMTIFYEGKKLKIYNRKFLCIEGP